MVEEINSLLSQICAELNEDSWNYSVCIEIFSALGMVGENTHDIVSNALKSPIILRNTSNVTIDEVLHTVSKFFDYSEGASSPSHPNSEFLGSPQFLLKKQEILDHLRDLLQEASQIMSFRIKEGKHPFCPVFWDYAFIIEKDNDAYVLIGSASD
jgi:hypothetical protein